MIFQSAILVLCAASCLAKFPSDIPRCRSGDVECVVKAANEVVRKFPNGRTDLGIAPIDPFVIHNFTINEQPGIPINMKLFLKRCEIRGLSNEKFEKAVGWTSDPRTSKYELYGTIPRLELDGEYKADGRILFLPIQGEGRFSIVLEKIRGGIKFKTDVIERNGLHYLKLLKVKIFLEPSNIRIKLTNLFNGNQQLGNAVNDILNENWEDAWTEFSPTILEIAGNFIKDTVAEFLDKNEYDDFYIHDDEDF